MNVIFDQTLFHRFMLDKHNVSVTTAFVSVRLIVLIHDYTEFHAMILTVPLESDLCRMEQIFIPDTQTSLCCSVLQHSGALARPKKHTSYNIASSTQCGFFCPEVMQNWWGSADVSQALKIETQLLGHVVLLFAAAEIIQTPSPLKYSSAVNPHSRLWCRTDCLKLN